MGRMLRSGDILGWFEEDEAQEQTLPHRDYAALLGKPVLDLEQLDALERASDEDPWATRQYDRFWPWPERFTQGQ